MFFFSSRRRHTRCALVTGVQTCALPIYGTPRPGQHGLEIVHPSYRVMGEGDDALDERLAPVYPAIEGVGPASVRRLVGLALDRLPDKASLELLPADALAGLETGRAHV